MSQSTEKSVKFHEDSHILNFDRELSHLHLNRSDETEKFIPTLIKNKSTLPITIVPKLLDGTDCDKLKVLEVACGTGDDDISSNNNSKISNSNNKNVKTERTGWKRYLGILLALQASILFPVAGLIVKALPQYHTFSLTFWRFQGILLPSIPMAMYYQCGKRDNIFSTVWPPQGKGSLYGFIFLRCFAGATAVVFNFYSLKFISMADSSVISFSTPVFVAIAGHVFLGEKFGFIPIISGLLTLAGVIVITRPPMLTGEKEFDTDNLIGTALALGSMIFATATFVVLRYLRKLHIAMLNIIFGTFGSIEALLLSWFIWKFQLPDNPLHWAMALALATLSFITQTSMTLSFKFEQAATVSLIRTCDSIFAFIWQFLLLGVVPDTFSVIGATVVITGILLVGFRKWLGELPEEDSRRQAFWILLK